MLATESVYAAAYRQPKLGPSRQISIDSATRFEAQRMASSQRVAAARKPTIEVAERVARALGKKLSMLIAEAARPPKDYVVMVIRNLGHIRCRYRLLCDTAPRSLERQGQKRAALPTPSAGMALSSPMLEANQEWELSRNLAWDPGVKRRASDSSIRSHVLAPKARAASRGDRNSRVSRAVGN